MKKVIFILLGISFILGGIIFVLYKNNYSKSDDVVDIFKEKDIGFALYTLFCKKIFYVSIKSTNFFDKIVAISSIFM